MLVVINLFFSTTSLFLNPSRDVWRSSISLRSFLYLLSDESSRDFKSSCSFFINPVASNSLSLFSANYWTRDLFLSSPLEAISLILDSKSLFIETICCDICFYFLSRVSILYFENLDCCWLSAFSFYHSAFFKQSYLIPSLTFVSKSSYFDFNSLVKLST